MKKQKNFGKKNVATEEELQNLHQKAGDTLLSEGKWEEALKFWSLCSDNLKKFENYTKALFLPPL